MKHLKMLNQTNILEATSQNIPTREEEIHRLKSKKTEKTEHMNATHNPRLDASFKGTKKRH